MCIMQAELGLNQHCRQAEDICWWTKMAPSTRRQHTSHLWQQPTLLACGAPGCLTSSTTAGAAPNVMPMSWFCSGLLRLTPDDCNLNALNALRLSTVYQACSYLLCTVWLGYPPGQLLHSLRSSHQHHTSQGLGAGRGAAAANAADHQTQHDPNLDPWRKGCRVGIVRGKAQSE